VKAGEHVLIVGESGAERTLLFRALAGLWPWGAGRIARHAAETTLYLPRMSYLPPGTLREVLAYPSEVAAFDNETCVKALERLGLERLSPLLDQARNWEAVLSDGDRQSLAFVRALLHAPAWLIISEAIDALERDVVPRVLDLFGKELAHTGVLYIGHAGAHDSFFGRTLHLIDDAQAKGRDSAQLTQKATASTT